MATRKNKRALSLPPTPWSPQWSHEAIEAEAALTASIRNLRHVFARHRGEPNWADPMDDKPASFTDRPANLSSSGLSEAEVSYFYSHAVCLSVERDRHILQATKYFLPRVFEVALRISDPGGAIKEGIAFDWWFIVQNMNQSRWLKWPAREKEAVEQFFSAWWAATIGYRARLDGKMSLYEQIPSERSADEFFRAASGISLTLWPMLDLWRTTRTAAAAAQLMELVRWRADELLTTGYLWNDEDTGAVLESQGDIVRWLVAPETADQLRDAKGYCVGDEASLSIDECIERLGSILPTWRSLADRGSFPNWVSDLTA